MKTFYSILVPIALLVPLTSCEQSPEPVNEEVAQVQQPVETPQQAPHYRIEDLMDSVTYRRLSFSSDGSKIATSSNASGIYNIVEMSVETGEQTAITNSTTDTNYLVSYFPDDDRILFTADQGGNEMHRLYVRELDGSIKNLTPEEGRFMTNFHGWANDGKSFYVQSNSRNIRHFDLYEISIDTYEKTLIYQNDDLYFLGPVSPDKKQLVLEKASDNRSRSMALHNLESGETKSLSLSDIHITDKAHSFSPDGKYLYYTTDKWYEFAYLMRYTMGSGEHSEVLKLDWDITGGFGNKTVRFSEDGSRILVASNQDARTVLDVFDVASMERIGGSTTPESSIASWDISKAGDTLALIVTNGQIPGDIYLQSIGSDSTRRLATSISEKIDPNHLVKGEVTRFSSYDGLIVPGILYKPLQASANNKLPALVYVHGGPGGETRIGYNPMIQFLVNNGYAVYGINNRGSSGSGKTFYHLDDQDHGAGDLNDVIASKQYLIDTGWVEPDQVGIIGGSYGGFMVLAALAFHPDVFDVGVDIFGVANWVNTLANPPPWWAAQWVAMQTEMGDFYDEKHWRARSPFFHADKIIKPLIVLQGANDARVIKAESDSMVAAARKNGTPVEYIVFDDEGHGFRKTKNQITGYTAIHNFLDKYLKGRE